MIYEKVSVVVVTKDRKKDLIECIDSYLKSTYPNLEIIIVDNASRPPVQTWLKPNKKIKIITSDVNLGAAQGRNRGFEVSTGKYIIFTDDDAYAGKNMVEELVSVFKKNPNAGIVQPLVYDKQNKNVLQGAGHDVDLITGRLRAWGVQELDNGQYEGLREVPMCGCVWTVKREVFEKIGVYDEDYFIPYEDSDFSIRARVAGYKLYCYSKAKTWHQGIKQTYVHPRVEWLGITSAERAFRVARNKIIFMRKHSPFPNNMLFFFVFLPGYIISHSLIILSTSRFDILFRYWLGILSGLWYVASYPFLGMRDIYGKIDNRLHSLKMFLLAWTDPIPWVMDPTAKTILDVGCGQGKSMQFIRMRKNNIQKSVGVDLFEPYIKLAKELKTHDEFILQDVRKIKFSPKSFDVVLSSHVIEHLTKKDALALLDKMEVIAKKRIIIATPIGETYHPAVDGNILQLHQSSFTPEEFQKRGYKTINYGWAWLLGEEGLVYKTQNDFLRKMLYTLNILITPIYYLFPSASDYVFVAYKDMQNKKV